MAARETMETLLALLRTRWTAQSPPALPEEQDWPALLTAAERHRVVPLLDETLLSLASPENRRCELHSRRLAIGARALYLMDQAARLAARFDRANIRALIWRGPILAQATYGDSSLRMADDIDCLVAPADIPLLLALMREEKFDWPLALDGTAERYYRRAVGEYVFWPPGREYQVEINIGIGARYFGWKIDFERLWENRRALTIMDRPVATLADEDLLALSCVHAGKHLWQRLQWVCDIAEILRGSPALDWDGVWRLAAELKSRRMVAAGLRLAHELLGAPLPAQQRESALALSRPVYEVTRDLMLGRDDRHQSPGRQFRYQWTMYDRLPARLRFAAGLVCQPSVGDWRWLRLPPGLYFLYYLLRPLRLAMRILRRL